MFIWGTPDCAQYPDPSPDYPVRILDLSENGFVEIPKGGCTMKNLEILALDDNQIQEIFVPLFSFLFYWYLPFAKSKFFIRTECHLSLLQWEGTFHLECTWAWVTPYHWHLRKKQECANTDLCVESVKLKYWLEGLLQSFCIFFSMYTWK